MVRIRRILAPNPGPFTGPGTNTYVLISEDECLIVDPGPIIADHRRAILDAVTDLQSGGVLVTHTHPDHAPLANPLASELDVPALGYAPGPEFDPGRRLGDGDRVRFGTEELLVVYTPGHSDDHLSFAVGDKLFTGDHIMGGSTVVVDDMTAYLVSLERLQEMDIERIFPGHGDEIGDPHLVISSYISHRLDRERQIMAAISGGAGTVGEVVEVVYTDVDPGLWPLAAHSVAAHLRKLSTEGAVGFEPPTSGELWQAPVSPSRS